ncbi:MAG TPA: SDR family oxidoreductase [Thermoanaerobaculia bacterium]|nr:SDR family oxidoreductase [Thermoanaerobaculia bacterium]
MRVLILGSGGMLGHKLYQTLRERFEVFAAFRAASLYQGLGLFDREHVVDGVDASNFDAIIGAMARVRPDAVVNCIGIIKQLAEANDPVRSLSINSLLPHRLAALCHAAGSRLIHISTDCVFSGRKGMYSEGDVSDAEDLYGRTKFLGEVAAPAGLTLRTSIIGRELYSTSGLVEWFLANRGKRVRGFTRAIYSGFTTIELSRLIARVISDFTDLRGMYHVSSEPISKYDLLLLAADAFDAGIEIDPDTSVNIDRSLNSDRFRLLTQFRPQTWPEMIGEMAADPTPYEQWRVARAS